MRILRLDRESARSGFTLVELAIVLIITSILIGVALPRIQGAFQQRDVTGVRDAVMLLAARARAQAMERASTVEFRLDVDGGVATVVEGGTTVEVVRFADDMGVTAESELSDITLCYTARGFATEPCSTSLGGPTRVVFSRMGYEAALEIWQLGQLRKP